MVSDFFYPSLGGVEMHMYNVAECLIEMGHKVIVITSQFNDERIGVRFMSKLLKVYYLPLNIMVNGTSWYDTFTNNMPILRHILIREEI
jgi:phosphatidylinositol glycan class A protein